MTTLDSIWAGLPSSWGSRLSHVRDQKWYHELGRFLDQELTDGNVLFPPSQHWFRSLHEVPYESVKVVILGQDPYHGDGQAMGASFAVPNTLRPKPPSLTNIFKEIASDIGRAPDANGSELTGWMSQGVLLLNTVLTVRKSEPLSHRNRGWENLTDAILMELNQREKPLVLLLWGAPAQKKRSLMTAPHHFVLEAPHPSPLSSYRGFFGCRHFSKANSLLEASGQTPIDWART